MIGIIRAVLALGSLALADVFRPPPELVDWAEDRYISCIFCMNYDDHNRVNIYGCSVANLPSCYGNVCYMLL
uniref:Secreted protein n=1 Tax=Panagrellus redivivus TaxID=6233 RepID=A0A7E4ZYH6_PANRE